VNKGEEDFFKSIEPIKVSEVIVKTKSLFLILCIGILIMFLAPFFFTKFALFRWSDLTDSGQIGDTIGGITSPIASVIGAVLVYYSFWAQQKANMLQIRSLDRSINLNKLENNFIFIRNLISDFKQEFERPTLISYRIAYNLSPKQYLNMIAGDYSEGHMTLDIYNNEENTNLIITANTFKFLKAIIDLSSNYYLYPDQKKIIGLQLYLYISSYLSKDITNLINDIENSEFKKISHPVSDIKESISSLNKFLHNNGISLIEL
jgi:hypothetical protein